MIKKIILALCAGTFLSATLFLHEPWLNAWLEKKVIDGFSQALDCSVTGKLQHFHLIFPAVFIEDMAMKPHEGKTGWQWRCKRFILRTSWWRLLRENTVALNITVEDLHADSAVVNNTFAIQEHIQKMIEDTPLPVSIALDSVTVNNGNFTAHDDERKIEFSCQWDSSVACPGKDLDLVMNIKQACLKKNATSLMQDCVGSISCGMKAEQPLQAHIDFSYLIPLLDQKPCILAASYAQDALLCQLATHDKTIDLHTIRMHKEGDTWRFNVAGSAQLAKLTQPCNLAGQINGECTVQATGVLCGNCPFTGTLNVDHVSHKELTDCAAAITFEGDMQSVVGSISGTTPFVCAEGTYAVDVKKRSAQLSVHNSKDIILPGINAPLVAQSCALTANVADWNELKGDVALSWTDDQKNKLTLMHSTVNWPYFNCDIPLASVRSCIKQYMQADIQGEGTVSLHGHYTDDALVADVVLQDGMIRLPQTYNFVNALSASCLFDFNKNKIVANDIAIRLHRGNVSVKNAQCHFKENSFVPRFIYVPCSFENVFLNVKKDLFTAFSGNLVVEKHDQEDLACRGHIILDRSQLKENLFSLAFQRQLFSHAQTSLPSFDAHLDIAIQTKEPIRVRTALLDANVKVQGQLTGSVSHPLVSGQIFIMSGTIALPYKPLFITKGVISCRPDTMHDPYLEFVAKNRIKKYNITMSVNGSLQQPAILLESSPPLTQEQIIALLLGGSEDSLAGALSGALSTVLTQSIKHIIFDTEHSPSKLHSAIDKLFSPFKHVRLVPSFADQTGRAGLRGAIEIDIGERWHALIQKNFSLTEDVRFEASYAIADDLVVRGWRDEHRDLGAEVEFRWKF